jgi:hypothetical protein
MHRSRCDSRAVAGGGLQKSKQPAVTSGHTTAATTAGENDKTTAEPPRPCDLISLMRKQFAAAGAGDEEEEEEVGETLTGKGRTASGPDYDYGNKQGTFLTHLTSSVQTGKNLLQGVSYCIWFGSLFGIWSRAHISAVPVLPLPTPGNDSCCGVIK